MQFGWNLHQLDIKNALLHRDLKEEVHMDIPPSLSHQKTLRKLCKLMKALYGLKQSPWTNSVATKLFGYQQRGVDFTIFFKHVNDQVAILIVYVDDIVVSRSL